MKPLRRNHYRILHVQPEAPVEIIQASYRTLMGPLRMHPDKGGDHETAALINEAWAVLGDPARRAAYDRSLKPVIARMRIGPHAAGSTRNGTAESTATGRPSADGVASRSAGAARSSRPACPFCSRDLPTRIAADTRCSGCSAPLTRAVPVSAVGRELVGRRGAPRVEKTQTAVFYPSCQSGPLPARLRDLSVTGISLYTGAAVEADQVLRLVAPDFESLLQVVSMRRRGPIWVVHGRLLTMLPTRRQGVFVSTSA